MKEEVKKAEIPKEKFKFEGKTNTKRGKIKVKRVYETEEVNINLVGGDIMFGPTQ
jgi:hypothetical protein